MGRKPFIRWEWWAASGHDAEGRYTERRTRRSLVFYPTAFDARRSVGYDAKAHERANPEEIAVEVDHKDDRGVWSWKIVKVGGVPWGSVRTVIGGMGVEEFTGELQPGLFDPPAPTPGIVKPKLQAKPNQEGWIIYEHTHVEELRRSVR